MRDIAFVVYPGYSVMALAAMTAFEVANMVSEEPRYELSFISETGGRVRTSAGMVLDTEIFSDRTYDTLIVGGATIPVPSTAGLVTFVRNAVTRSRRIAAVCTGAFVLAEAGLLDGRHATTHWLYARDMQKKFQKIIVEEDRIFINDGPIWTSAGMTAGLDLCLALIENDLGQEIAKAVARKLVIYHRRGGGQSQFSALLELTPKSDRIQAALSYARENLHKPLSVPDLAEVAHLSPRQFSRAFHAETGQSPAKAIENLRVEAARNLMEQSRHPIDLVARHTGFSDRDHMRRAFLRAFGQPPQVLRRQARQQPADYDELLDDEEFTSTLQ
ncbi:AraC family transcriptional regulator [Gluconacetobacter liquefaciens]|uniref:AraC family transcriptional regulator with amidase-like domain n=1 Tax=Gluconacetobacter liquefaciens TaxID=89584 RepID=A0A370G625_GLULI|nr:GlxA family transcriptional regulator [Gluconacetobacter liquefaciens]MBB2185465.1 GlxA family transcriptional regulator [Gluconacetobacter liquefaciens]RDI39268.1 AraC family transcriptional regulator with amidase-like domain [Gluconacetobacter liquefaciens]GBQ94476.1 AraC family transcriptional regulator [Gluconacetobacter liquefaciens NRIC 0522]GEB38040.1 AraC family transcriptional regulator [Gluconacetobacter liquefaciens]